MKTIILTILVLFSFTSLAATAPKEAYSMLISGEAVFIDVREENEIKEGMIEKARWFPLSKIQSDANWKEDFLKITSGKKIFLYCRSGNRSGKVQKILEEKAIPSENIGGYETLKTILPTTK